MANYPVSIHVKEYSGRDQNLVHKYHNRIEAGNTIEAYLNKQMKDEKENTFAYYDIAQAVGLQQEVVKEILFRVDGGSNGITIRNEGNNTAEKKKEEK